MQFRRLLRRFGGPLSRRALVFCRFTLVGWAVLDARVVIDDDHLTWNPSISTCLMKLLPFYLLVIPPASLTAWVLFCLAKYPPEQRFLILQQEVPSHFFLLVELRANTPGSGLI